MKKYAHKIENMPLQPAQNLQMPHPWDWKGGQMPHSSRGGGGGGGRVQLELTDA